MRKLDWFNRNPKAENCWLAQLGLKQGELVLVNGHVYRYGFDGKEHFLQPAQVKS